MAGEKYIGSLLDLVLPRVCAVCGKRLGDGEEELCGECSDDIPYTYNWSMPHNEMADKFNALVQRDLEKEGAFEFEEYSFAAALFFYRSGSDYRNLSRSLKYHGNVRLGRKVARLLGERLAASPQFRDVDLVVPVPLHWTRKWKRGYNQAEIVAKEVAAALGAGLEPKLLRRNRRTKTQTKLSGEAKARNVEGAFSPNTGRLEALGDAPRHVLLIDDVFTTGSTLIECRRSLRKVLGSDVRISVATLGYVGQ